MTAEIGPPFTLVRPSIPFEKLRTGLRTNGPADHGEVPFGYLRVFGQAQGELI